MGGQGSGSRGDVGAGGGGGKIISIRGAGEVGGVGVGGHIKIKQDGRDAGALRDSCVDMSVGGRGVGVSAAGHPPPKVGG